jgi:carbon-monoxide dehydrogenase large subunit
MTLDYVGQPVLRIDAPEKVTGRAVYTVDMALPGMLHGAVKRSSVPHGRILRIDASKAQDMPGVRAVVCGRDFLYCFGPMIQDQTFLALDKVRYVGEPVVAVAAETEAIARAAADRIVVEYEELPAVFDAREAAREGAPLVHADLEKYDRNPRVKIVPGTNICTELKFTVGDIQAGFAEADEIFEDEFLVHPVSHTPMEPHAAIAQYFPATGSFTFWSSTDAPHRRAGEFARALGLPLNKVRFISPYSGGGFGGKGALLVEAIVAALARFTDGLPVKLVFQREEVLTASQTRVGAWIRLKTGVKRDGRLVVRQAEMIWDSGAYASKSPEVASRGALTVFGPYRIPNVDFVSRLVYTNKEMASAYRGFGTTQVTWASEVQMDIIARRLNIDALALRQLNGYREGDAYTNGQVMQSVGLQETLARSAREIGWGQEKPAADGIRCRGRGIATMLKGTNTPTESYCIIRVDQDGGVSVLTSTVEVGAGQKTIIAQIAAETLGFPLESVVVPQPDTAFTPYDFGVTSSRSTFHMGNAVRLAAEDARKKILAMAAATLKVSAAGLRLRKGVIYGEDGRELIGLQEVMTKNHAPQGGTVIGEGRYTPAGSPALASRPGMERMSSAFWMFVTHAAEVEVDTETGVVRVVKVAAAHDLGRAINPLTCRQQIEGSVIMGLSNALLEEFKLDRGRILNDSLADYKIASIKDIPEIVSILVESSHPEAPYGAKGVGEPAAAATAPAIANAIYDAIGVRIRDLPITPEKILAGLRERDRA